MIDKFLHLRRNFCPGIRTPKKDKLIILGSLLGLKSQEDLLETKSIELEKVNGIISKNRCALWIFSVEKLLQSAKVLPPENQFMF